MTRSDPHARRGAPRRRASRPGRVAIAASLIAASCGFVSAAAAADTPPSIPWARVRNPILSSAVGAVKDPAVVWAAGNWHAVVSSVGADGRWRIGLSTSPDLTVWSPLTTMPHDPAVEGEASPDVSRAPTGAFVVTYQSFVHDAGGTSPKLYYRTTTDFRTFSPAHPLGLELHPGGADRVIDAALDWTPAGLMLGYKVGGADGSQAFELARSTTGSLDGPWQLIGRPAIRVLSDTIENYQFLHLGRQWLLLATSNQFDRPFLFTLTGNPRDPRGWLRWSPGRELRIPTEPWNEGRGVTGVSYEHANCAFLVNRGPVGGRFYLVYSDAPEVTQFGGAGHAVLAVARSRDLVHWSVPPR